MTAVWRCELRSQIQRVRKKPNFPLAFAAMSRYVTGNLKTAARKIRKELLAETAIVSSSILSARSAQ